MKKCFYQACLFFVCSCFVITNTSIAQPVQINDNKKDKKLSFGNEKIRAVLDYNQRVSIISLIVNKQSVIKGDSGMYSMIKTKTDLFSTLQLLKNPSVDIHDHTINIKDIVYGMESNVIEENWTIAIARDSIRFDIVRNSHDDVSIEQAGLPVFQFQDIHTWDGAYQDYGGLAWFYLFNKKLDTYGVHSRSSRFWNAATGNGLTISADAGDNQVAMEYRRTLSNKLAFSIDVSPDEFIYRFDSGTNRRRYTRDTTAWIWSPYTLPKGTTKQSFTLSYFNFEDQYGRGKLAGINQKQVSAVLNTIARIGVIDKQHFGGNSWHTPYGPICLHEQYIAQMGLAINDPSYTTGYRECLDFYRDKAIKPDGHVWPRWAYTNEDAMQGQFNSEGFYEAQWGYLMDSNPDYVTNVSELYDQNGDLDWVRTHQLSCERALDWILQRDENKNGLVEMMTDSTAQKRGSDWIDIIWASYENAFVNAKLYHALLCWSDIEKQLGNDKKAKSYLSFADKLKTSFNKPVSEGGFWDEKNKCYIHWRDKDGSLHGRNTVIPVNFMAIGYGICTDVTRTKTILDNVEAQMQKEKLFFWPLCLYSYAPGEGNDWQFPFPNYENGDIFLSWGALGVKVYASYKPALAVKYVKQVLAQYAKDGLAFQRYGRNKQNGLGDDILSGNSLAVVGLYQAVYGINPLHNRFYLNPHITPELAGTQLRHNYQNKPLLIHLDKNLYTVSDGRYSISSAQDFGYKSQGDTLSFFKSSNEQASLQIINSSKTNLSITIKNWSDTLCSWHQSASGKLTYKLTNLRENTLYKIWVDDKSFTEIKTDNKGSLSFDNNIAGKQYQVVMEDK